MSFSLPPIILYPLYPGGPQVRMSNALLNANSSFRTQANAFVPAYGVNLPTDLSQYEADTYFTLRGAQTISRRPVSEAPVFTTPLGFDGTMAGGLKRVSAPAVAPEIPNVFKAAERLLAVSELNMAELLALPEFRLPNIGLGLKVTTDGLGGVDSTSIDPSIYAATLPLDVTNQGFGGLNSAEITTGATFKPTDLSIDTGPVNPAAANNSPTVIANNVLASQATQSLSVNKLDRNAGIFNLQNLEDQALLALRSQSPELERLTPELERLYQLQLEEQGLQGVQAFDRNALQSQQLAASQVGLGVKTSEKFQANVVGLINANKQSESYANIFAPKMDQLMNGKIAATPWTQGQSANAAGSGLGNASGFEMGAAVADAMNRKGRGSYIPFRMQSGNPEQGFGNANPFLGSGTGTGTGAGSSQLGGQAGQQYRPRKPLAFTA